MKEKLEKKLEKLKLLISKDCKKVTYYRGKREGIKFALRLLKENK